MTASGENKSVLLDSSCWIEILRDGDLAKPCQKYLQTHSKIIVPSLVIYEVYRKLAASVSEDHALSCVALLSQHHVVDLTRDISLNAADLSLQHKLPMAASIVLAHAHGEGALLVTMDNDFAEISGCKIIR